MLLKTLRAALEMCNVEAYAVPFKFDERGLEARGLGWGNASFIELTIPEFKGSGERMVVIGNLLRALKTGKADDIVKLRLDGDELKVIMGKRTAAIKTEPVKEEAPSLTFQYAAIALVSSGALTKAVERAMAKAREERRTKGLRSLRIEIKDAVYINAVGDDGTHGPAAVVKPIKLTATMPIEAEYQLAIDDIIKLGSYLNNATSLKIASRIRVEDSGKVYERELKALTLEYNFNGGRLAIHMAPMAY